MNKKLINGLQEAFEVPPPVDKERFLKNLPYPKSRYRDFFFSQLGYIRKRVWILSAVFVLAGWAVAFLSPGILNWHIEAGKVWIVSAVLPFLALLTVTEIYRSAFCRMAELEGSCRFSLQQIIMARISILGGGNISVLALLLFFMNRVSPYGLLRILLYLGLPYLITCGTCLLILNQVHGKESIYVCAAAACIVSMINLVLSNMIPLLYTNTHLVSWLFLSAAAILLIGVQTYKLLKRTEGNTWNLLLTE